MKKIIALLLCVVFVFGCTGCGKQETGTSAGLPVNVNEIGNDYSTIDDMPDWTGDKLDLVVWYGYGSNETYIGKNAKEDKFRDEMERVTGVKISDSSFDNGGQTGDTKIAKMVSTGNWPHIGMGLEASIAESLQQEGMLYDLSELIPKYMPNYWKMINSHEEIKKQYDRVEDGDALYGLRRLHKRAFQFADPEYTPEKYAKVIQPADSRNWIWVRDDILKQIYPEAKTMAEIKKIYMEKGKFDAEDMNDVTIKSKEEFRGLLEKINELNITEGGRKVWPFYTHAGEDNWDLLTIFGPSLAGAGGANSDVVNDFTYYDGNKDQMVITAEQDWFKELCWFFTELVIDDVASREALVDNKTAFDQKKTNGEYAIFYGNMIPPTDEVLKAAGKDFSYRKVMIDIPGDYNTFVRRDASKGVFDNYPMYFFKSLNETQLEQTLRFIDFFYSEAGMKFANWGPKKAGLYEEDENGNMRYIDEKWEAAQLYDGDQQVYIDYGLYSFPRIDYFLVPDGLNKYQPELIYGDDLVRTESDWSKAWNYSFADPLPDFPYTDMGWQIYSFGKYSENINAFWNARQSSEDALKKIFTAANREEFDRYYDEMVKKLSSNGLNEEATKEMTQILEERCGDTYNDLKNWTSNK